METAQEKPLLEDLEADKGKGSPPCHFMKWMNLAILQLAFLTVYTIISLLFLRASRNTHCREITLLYCQLHQSLLINLA